jgi:hypothetical protein
VASPKKTSAKTTKAKTPTKVVRPRLLPVLRDLDVDVFASATLNGAGLDAALIDAIGDVERDITMDGANVLSLPLLDADQEILRSELLAGPISLDLGRGGRWVYDRTRDIGGISVQDDLTTLRMWCIGSAALRGQTQPLRRSSDRMGIDGWTRLFAREVADTVALRAVVPDPGDVPPAETTSETGSASKASGHGFSAAAAAKLTVKGERATTEQLRTAEVALRVAREEKAGAKATKALIAAGIVESLLRNLSGGDRDSEGFLQVRVGIHGREIARSVERSAKAFLTRGFTGKGGAIKLTRENSTWTAGQVAQAVQGSAFPRRYDQYGKEADAIIAAWSGNGGEESSSTSSRTVSRPAQWRRGSTGKPESSWTSLDREAKRLGRRRFIALPWSSAPRLVVASDQQLIQAQPHITLSGLEDSVLVERPAIDLEGIKTLQQVELSVFTAGWVTPPGGVVELTDCGDAVDGPWLVQRIVAQDGSEQARVTLQQPTTTVQAQESASTAAGKRSGSTGSSSSRVDRVYEECLKISNAGGPYLYGGGHGPALSSLRSGQGLDCSSSCSLALERADQYKGATAIVSGDFAKSFGRAGRGSNLTVWANGEHVWIEHRGKRYWRFDTSPYGDGGRGPRVRHKPRPTAGFTARHLDGW